MPDFDATTILLVTALLGAVSGLVWCLLAGLFRVAPHAGLMLAGAQFLALPAMLRNPCLVPLRPYGMNAVVPEAALILSGALLALSVGRLLRLRPHRRWVAAIAALALVIELALALAPPGTPGMHRVASLALALLAGRAALDIFGHAGPGIRPAQSALLALPVAVLALTGVANSLPPSWLPTGALLRPLDCANSAPLAWGWMLVTLGMTISLIVITLNRLFARIEHLTLRDPLTGVLNRRALEQELIELQQGLARGRSACVMLIDVDHFKALNDQHGHAAGDAGLVHLVSCLQGQLRSTDLLGRLGGEEFCVLLPDTRLEDALRVAQRMCDALSMSGFRHAARLLPLRASFGVARCASGDPDGRRTLAAADAQLYRAKAEGRDRVCGEDLSGAPA